MVKARLFKTFLISKIVNLKRKDYRKHSFVTLYSVFTSILYPIIISNYSLPDSVIEESHS